MAGERATSRKVWVGVAVITGVVTCVGLLVLAWRTDPVLTVFIGVPAGAILSGVIKVATERPKPPKPHRKGRPRGRKMTRMALMKTGAYKRGKW